MATLVSSFPVFLSPDDFETNLGHPIVSSVHMSVFLSNIWTIQKTTVLSLPSIEQSQ